MATEAKKPTVIDGMDSRRMFTNPEEAAAYLNASAEKFADFETVPKILRGFDDEGNFLTDVYTDQTRVMVAVLANRGAEKGQPSTVKAIVVTPVPTLDAVLADEAARKWLTDKVLDKELNHVAVRALRTADDPEDVADQMPLTLADYITSGRDSTGGLMDTFNQLYKGIIASVGQKSTAWAKRRFVKSELKKAMESAAYAREYFPELEDRGEGKLSMLVMAIQLGKREALAAGLDPAIFDRWLETRNQRALTTKDADESEDDFDLDDLAFESGEPKADAATPAAETEAKDDAPASDDSTDTTDEDATGDDTTPAE